MPINVTNTYLVAGAVAVNVYTAHEMAAALNTTVEHVKELARTGVIECHMQPDTPGNGTPGSYQFTARNYANNKRRTLPGA